MYIYASAFTYAVHIHVPVYAYVLTHFEMCGHLYLALNQLPEDLHVTLLKPKISAVCSEKGAILLLDQFGLRPCVQRRRCLGCLLTKTMCECQTV